MSKAVQHSPLQGSAVPPHENKAHTGWLHSSQEGQELDRSLGAANGFPGRRRAVDPRADLAEKQWPLVGRDSLPAACGEVGPSSCQMNAVAGEQPGLLFTRKLLVVVLCPDRYRLKVTQEQGTETPALRKLPHRDYQFKACLGYKIRFCFGLERWLSG